MMMNPTGQNSTNVTRVKVGEEIGQLWGPVWDGTVTNGSQNFKDLTSPGLISSDRLMQNQPLGIGNGNSCLGIFKFL